MDIFAIRGTITPPAQEDGIAPAREHAKLVCATARRMAVESRWITTISSNRVEPITGRRPSLRPAIAWSGGSPSPRTTQTPSRGTVPAPARRGSRNPKEDGRAAGPRARRLCQRTGPGSRPYPVVPVCQLERTENPMNRSLVRTRLASFTEVLAAVTSAVLLFPSDAMAVPPFDPDDPGSSSPPPPPDVPT
jgi:hypothetical protein